MNYNKLKNMITILFLRKIRVNLMHMMNSIFRVTIMHMHCHYDVYLSEKPGGQMGYAPLV